MTDINELVNVYRNIREHKTTIVRAHKDEVGELDEQMKAVSVEIHKTLDSMGLESVKTESGTAFKTTKDFVNVQDIEEFRTFLSETVAKDIYESLEFGGGVDRDGISLAIQEMFPWHYFTKAISKDAVKTFMKDNEGRAPDGVGYDQQIEVQIRK